MAMMKLGFMPAKLKKTRHGELEHRSCGEQDRDQNEIAHLERRICALGDDALVHDGCFGLGHFSSLPAIARLRLRPTSGLDLSTSRPMRERASCRKRASTKKGGPVLMIKGQVPLEENCGATFN